MKWAWFALAVVAVGAGLFVGLRATDGNSAKTGTVTKTLKQEGPCEGNVYERAAEGCPEEP